MFGRRRDLNFQEESFGVKEGTRDEDRYTQNHSNQNHDHNNTKLEVNWDNMSQPSSMAEIAPEITSEIAPELKQLRLSLLEKIDASVALTLDRKALKSHVFSETAKMASELKLPISLQQHRQLTEALLDDMLGFGPIQSLLDDEQVSDILVNGAHQVYVERNGILEETSKRFFDEAHVKHIARRIAASIGRRIDESQPMVDARLEDGSRVNIVIPPLSLNGTSISIRKFNRKGFSLCSLAEKGAMSFAMAEFLSIATSCRANILISGGTGAGKTSLLNAMSKAIHPAERIVTIEDAAELSLQQPHVVRLETRHASIEGTHAINQQKLLVNALRMRPDRIILGEVRSVEAFDMMQAMNTGHDGSMSTIHANSPSDALIRLENLLLMSQNGIPLNAIRRQMVSALDIVIQICRDRKGNRRVEKICEVTGIEGDNIQLQDLFVYEGLKDQVDSPTFKSTGVRPFLLNRAEKFGLTESLLAATSTKDISFKGNTCQSVEGVWR